MMIAIIALAIVLILLGLLWLLKTSGLFKPILINITQPPFDQITIIYKFHRGAYSKSGDAFRTLGKYSPLHLKFGIYYDDPELVSSRINKNKYNIYFIIRYLSKNDDLLLVLWLMKQKIKT
jgi:hypothetical protein